MSSFNNLIPQVVATLAEGLQPIGSNGYPPLMIKKEHIKVVPDDYHNHVDIAITGKHNEVLPELTMTAIELSINYSVNYPLVARRLADEIQNNQIRVKMVNELQEMLEAADITRNSAEDAVIRKLADGLKTTTLKNNATYFAEKIGNKRRDDGRNR